MSELFAEPAMQTYAICAAVLVLKMWLTGNVTGITRIVRGVYITQEDYQFTGKTDPGSDPLIDRLRRIHQNDLENILPFLAVGFLYALTGPAYGLAWWLFLLFTLGRIGHTITYVTALQPWRTLFYEIGNLTLVAITVLLLINLF